MKKIGLIIVFLTGLVQAKSSLNVGRIELPLPSGIAQLSTIINDSDASFLLSGTDVVVPAHQTVQLSGQNVYLDTLVLIQQGLGGAKITTQIISSNENQIYFQVTDNEYKSEQLIVDKDGEKILTIENLSEYPHLINNPAIYCGFQQFVVRIQ